MEAEIAGTLAESFKKEENAFNKKSASPEKIYKTYPKKGLASFLHNTIFLYKRKGTSPEQSVSNIRKLPQSTFLKWLNMV